jgi:hypothetical protein
VLINLSPAVLSPRAQGPFSPAPVGSPPVRSTPAAGRRERMGGLGWGGEICSLLSRMLSPANFALIFGA